MAVVLVKRTFFEPAGFVADFCPVCGEFQTFSVENEESELQLYFVSINAAQLMSTRAQCAGCGHIRHISPDDYARFSPEPRDIHTLLQETNPNGRENRAADIALWEKMRQTPENLTIDERQRVMDGVLAAMKGTLELRHAVTDQANVRLNPSVAIASIAPFLLFCLGLLLFDRQFEQTSDGGQIAGILTGCFGLPAVCGYAMWVRQKRRLWRHVAGMFAAGTRPLRLNPDALRELVDHSAVSNTRARGIALQSMERHDPTV